MSASEIERQLLLSAALDGALDDAERTLFERELRSDPAFAQEWQELQLLRSELKRSLGYLRKQKPSADLAAKVVAAAFATDRETNAFSAVAGGSGVASNDGRVGHKQLRRPVSQVPPSSTSTLTASGRRAWTARIAGALALAASLMVMVSWLTNFDTAAPSSQQLVDSGASIGTEAEPLPSASEDPSALAMQETDQAVQEAAPRVEAALQKDALPPIDQVAKSVEVASADEMKPSIAVVADNQKAAATERTPLKVLLVFSVQVTDKGREQLALQSALRLSGIRLGPDTVVSDQVVSQLRESNVVTTSDVPANGAKLFFIEGSAKKIDRLVTEMVNQPEMFGSVSMSLATDPPLLASMTSLPVADPTQVKSSVAESVALNMVSSDSRPITVAESYPFLPVDRSMVQMGVAGMSADQSQQNQDDFTSQLLLIVR